MTHAFSSAVASLTIGLDRRGRSILIKLRLLDDEQILFVLPSRFALQIADNLLRWCDGELPPFERQPDIMAHEWNAIGRTATRIRCDDYPNGMIMDVQLRDRSKLRLLFPPQALRLLSHSLELCRSRLVGAKDLSGGRMVAH